MSPCSVFSRSPVNVLPYVHSVVLVTQLCPTLCDPVDLALQAPQPMRLTRQEYCSGLPFPSPGDLPDPGLRPASPALQADSLLSEPQALDTS